MARSSIACWAAAEVMMTRHTWVQWHSDVTQLLKATEWRQVPAPYLVLAKHNAMTLNNTAAVNHAALLQQVVNDAFVVAAVWLQDCETKLDGLGCAVVSNCQCKVQSVNNVVPEHY